MFLFCLVLFRSVPLKHVWLSSSGLFMLLLLFADAYAHARATAVVADETDLTSNFAVLPYFRFLHISRLVQNTNGRYIRTSRC